MPLIPPKIVNRGGAGLLQKLSQPATTEVVPVLEGRQNDIRCVGQVVPVTDLVPDPDNARLHPERNLEAIKDSLREYGQRSCLVVRRQNMVVAKGNGTLEAAKALGWTKIAADLQDMTDEEFWGYALADNRTAELATWDFEVVSRIDRLLRESKLATIGWSRDELEVLRADGFVPPPEEFPEVGEDLETEHLCPRCGYAFSGGESQQTDMAAEVNKLRQLNEELAARCASQSDQLSLVAERRAGR